VGDYPGLITLISPYPQLNGMTNLWENKLFRLSEYIGDSGRCEVLGDLSIAPACSYPDPR
jgi:hypothetical protein